MVCDPDRILVLGLSPIERPNRESVITAYVRRGEGSYIKTPIARVNS